MAFAYAAAPAGATVPGTPRVPQDPSSVFHEDFEHGSSLTPVPLEGYVGRPTGAPSVNARYTADGPWLEDCNGAIVAFESDDEAWGKALCPAPAPATGAWAYVRMMAWALGSVQGEEPAAARVNHAVTAWTYIQNPGAGLVQLRTLPETPITFPQRHDRFITFSIDAAELCAPPAQPGAHNLAQFEFYLVNQQGEEKPAFNEPIEPCSDERAQQIQTPGVGNRQAGATFNVGQFASDGAVLFSGDTLGIVMRNAQGLQHGNDAAFDDIHVIDATPQLDKSFSPEVLNRGETTHLTFTVTNTSDLAAKEGWSFTDSLAPGLSVVDEGKIENECGGSVRVETVGGREIITVQGSLAAGQHYCTVTVPVTSATNGTYVNGPDDVEVSGVNPPGEANVEFGDADLAIAKHASEHEVEPGSEVTYTLTVKNHGPLTAEGITVTDPLAGLEFVSASPGCVHTGGVVRCELASLAASPDAAAEHTFTVLARIPDSHTGGIANTATVRSETPDPFLGNNEDTAIVHSRRKVDLSIEKVASRHSVGPLDQLTYTLVVSNHGPHAAQGVIVTDPLARGLEVVSVQASQGRCRTSAGVVCRLGQLAKGATAQIMVTVIVNRHDHGTVPNTATVDSEGTDLNPDDNVAHAKVRVHAPRSEELADLVVTKHADHALLTRGAQVAYLITVKDRGVDDATGVRLIDTPSFGGRVVSVKPSQGTCKVEGDWLTCELGRIETGAKATVRVVVEPTHPGDAKNTVGVTSEELDPEPADNLAGATVRVGREPALGVGCHKAGVRLTLPTTRVAAPGGIRAITIKVGDRLIRHFGFSNRLPTARVVRGVRFGTAGLSPGLHKITILVEDADGDVTRRVLRFTICPQPRFTG